MKYMNPSRAAVILAKDFYRLIEWYEHMFGLPRVQLVDDRYRYAILDIQERFDWDLAKPNPWVLSDPIPPMVRFGCNGKSTLWMSL